MEKKSAVALLELFKIELRTVLALALLLVVLVGLGFAAGDPTVTFDFGSGLSTEIAPGSIPVNGGSSVYPQVSGQLQYGWQTPYVTEQSSGTQVANLFETDSNQGVGDNTFIISGLTAQYYTVTLVSGTLNNSITTKVVVNGTNYVINSDPGIWKTLTFKTATAGGNIEFNFKRYGANLWAINSLSLIPSSTPPPEQAFDLVIQPAEHLVTAGGTAVYQISVLSNNGYSSEVVLSLTGLPQGMTAMFSPASGFPTFTAKLEISTSADAPIARRVINLSAQGKDSGSYTLNKDIILFVVHTNDNAVSQTPPVDSRTVRQQAIAQQQFIDAYIVSEKTQLITPNELMSLRELSADTAFPVLPELPAARSIIDASLRQLTNVGIISMVVDSAPAAMSAPPPKVGFWAQFFGSMFNPAS
ncbi:MAG: hypothetical protein V1807_02410 [Patescibacteria group bacterium]